MRYISPDVFNVFFSVHYSGSIEPETDELADDALSVVNQYLPHYRPSRTILPRSPRIPAGKLKIIHDLPDQELPDKVRDSWFRRPYVVGAARWTIVHEEPRPRYKLD